MAQRHVEKYSGFEIVIEVVAVGDCRVRIAQQTIQQAAYRFSTAVDFDDASRRVFSSVKDAYAAAAMLAREEIDRMVRRGPHVLH
jgi:hypothetical protein